MTKLRGLKIRSVWWQIFLFCSATAITFAACTTADDLSSFRNENIDTYNKEIEEGNAKREHWTSNPLLIVHQLFVSNFNPEGKPYMNIEQRMDSIDHVTLTITQEGVIDDSVSGEKRVINFTLKNGRWIITHIRVGLKCHKNRGHTYYSGEGCS
jgi:hypothetical protein